MQVFVLSIFLSTVCALAVDTVPQVGQAAPDFTLPSQDGGKISLHDFKGKWVVLYFYPKDGTQGCTIEAHNFQRDLPKYEKWGAKSNRYPLPTTMS
ncbi:MAG: redoxin domain-containing protein [Acidobacteriia bacterium]|nr:redoxin domain-containing protein [Terriglobia bacterium]